MNVQEKLTEAFRAYHSMVQDVVDRLDLSEEERQQDLDQLYERYEGNLRKIGGEWSHDLDKRGAELEKSIYEGGAGYQDAVRRLTNATPEQLEQAVKVARRTKDSDTLRAAAVVARESGNSQLFYGAAEGTEFGAAFEELTQIPDHDTRARFLSQFLPPEHPSVKNLAPSEQAKEKQRLAELHQTLDARMEAQRRSGVGRIAHQVIRAGKEE